MPVAWHGAEVLLDFCGRQGLEFHLKIRKDYILMINLLKAEIALITNSEIYAQSN